MTKKQVLDTSCGRVAVGYCRVSSVGQADRGISLEAQQAKAQALVALHDLRLREIITDGGESGGDMARPGLQSLLMLVDQRRVSVVIVAKLDRLTRSVKDLGILLERFERRGVALMSAAESLDTSSAAGRLVMNIMVSVSGWERETAGERTATVLQHKRAHMRVYSRISPFGYQRQGDMLVPDPQEQATVQRIQAYRASRLTLQRIADLLNESGTPTKQAGGRWYPSTISNVLALHQTLKATA